jgi:hypothetical protein
MLSTVILTTATDGGVCLLAALFWVAVAIIGWGLFLRERLGLAATAAPTSTTAGTAPCTACATSPVVTAARTAASVALPPPWPPPFAGAVA